MQTTNHVTGYNRDYGEIDLSHADVKSCFDPVVERILALVESQVNAVEREGLPQIETIILVGGMGDSPYVRERLREWAQRRDISITTPWSGG